MVNFCFFSFLRNLFFLFEFCQWSFCFFSFLLNYFICHTYPNKLVANHTNIFKIIEIKQYFTYEYNKMNWKKVHMETSKNQKQTTKNWEWHGSESITKLPSSQKENFFGEQNGNKIPKMTKTTVKILTNRQNMWMEEQETIHIEFCGWEKKRKKNLFLKPLRFFWSETKLFDLGIYFWFLIWIRLNFIQFKLYIKYILFI